MRLLDTTTLQLSEFFDEQRPPYAILSHRWGDDEVTLKDLDRLHKNGPQHPSSSSTLSRAGYKKIKGCCDLALREGYQWVWVDTCCIDKTSSAELSEAINSMFAWYKESEVCYAFLSDVNSVAEDISAPDSPFRMSTWFTRGWTLQELLAPRRMNFLNRDWQSIGLLTEGSTLSDVVGEITSIPPAFLHGLDLRNASVAMRMSWASQRKTARKEDIAYCLLGIFHVNMPLLYGEGVKAFGRLQEEIVKRTYDHSLLAWGLLPWDEGCPSSHKELCGVLAPSVTDFAHCGGLTLCPSFVRLDPSKDYQLTNQGLRVQLPLRAPRIDEASRRHKYMAVLDCFDRHDPSRRIAIPLYKLKGTYRMKKLDSYADIAVADGDMFVRAGRSLLLSDLTPSDLPSGNEYISKSIQIRVENEARTFPLSVSSSLVSVIDFPRHYRYDVTYVHPEYKADKDPHAVKAHSLQIKRRSFHELRDPIVDGPETEKPLARGFIKRCACYLALFIINMLVNILEGRHPYARIQPQLDSIVVCVQLTQEHHTLSPVEPASFIAFFAYVPIPFWSFFWSSGRDNVRGEWRLAPLPDHPLQESVHPSGMSPGFAGQNSLRLAHETLIVRDFRVRWWDHSKIEVKEPALIQPKPRRRQRLWHNYRLIRWFMYCHRHVLVALAAYGIVIGALAVLKMDGDRFYVTIWTLCFMPIIYEVRYERVVGYQLFGVDEGLVLRLVIVFFSVGISLYPALRPTLGWWVCTSLLHGSPKCGVTVAPHNESVSR